MLLFFDNTSTDKVEHRLRETGNKQGTSKNFWANFRSSSQQNKEEKNSYRHVPAKALRFRSTVPKPACPRSFRYLSVVKWYTLLSSTLTENEEALHRRIFRRVRKTVKSGY